MIKINEIGYKETKKDLFLPVADRLIYLANKSGHNAWINKRFYTANLSTSSVWYLENFRLHAKTHIS